MRIAPLALAFVAVTAIAVVPTADARPQCLQVYPWSEFCQGNYEVVCGWVYWSPDDLQNAWNTACPAVLP